MMPDNQTKPEPKIVDMSFEEILPRLKAGEKFCRKNWNGHNMWIALGGAPVILEAEKFWNPHARKHATQAGGKAVVDPYFIMKTSQGSIQMGWLASQADLLANDWEVAK